MYDIWQYFPLKVRQDTAALFDSCVNTPESVGYHVPNIIKEGLIWCPLGYALRQLGCPTATSPYPFAVAQALIMLNLAPDSIEVQRQARAYAIAQDNQEIYNIYEAMGIPRP
jgi:hypothetical protein